MEGKTLALVWAGGVMNTQRSGRESIFLTENKEETG
jgi:hypothetical protein